MADIIKCTKCGEEQPVKNYYKSYSPLHENTGYVPTCKQCIYKMYKDFIYKGKSEKSSVIEVCKLLDKPFIESVFESVSNQYLENDMERFFGEFFKQVHMQQWRRKGIYRFEHSIYNKNINENNMKIDNDEKIYSKDWTGFYTQVEIDYLNNYLKGLHEDFKIITTNHKDYAKKIAQASLAMNKAYQDMLNGDSGSDKRYGDLQKVFDNLSKSAQFSENTRSANDVGIASISQIVERVENKEWIYEPEDIADDKIDKLLSQFSNINKSV
jgi:hypothetical protein